MIRPVGISAGGAGLALAWIGGAAIAELTGATPVVLVLAAGLVMFVAAAIDGLISIVRMEVVDVVLPHHSVQGEPVAVTATVAASRPVWIELWDRGSMVADGWTTTTDFSADAVFEARGPVDRVEVRARSAGLLGLAWWGRRVALDVGRHLVAPAGRRGTTPIDRIGIASDGDLAGSSGAISGELDGVRPWRDGDSEKFVHWSSSFRSGELMVHDRRQNADQRWVVRARSGTGAPDVEAGAARWAIEQGLRSGVSVHAAVDQGEPVSIDHVDSAVEWAALAPLGPPQTSTRTRWRERFRRTEPDRTASVSARWWAAAATLASLFMLTGALGYSVAIHILVAVSIAAGATVSARSLVSGEEPPLLIRVLVGAGAMGAFAMVVAASGRLDGILSMLRGPLPQVLVILILLHGFECRDRRTIRVSLGISAVVLMYASGFRVDGAVGWWLGAWAICFGVSMAKLSGPTIDARSRTSRSGVRSPARAWVVRSAGIGAGILSTIAVLALVPVPDGPARLTLPTLIKDAERVTSPGAIAGPNGELRNAGDDPADGQRAPAGQAGGYTGFAQSMDTSVRGDLGDQIVMRVRAPAPDFWRGQTFARFDGRTWYADDQIGTARSGPNIDVPPALGDLPIADDIQVDRFVQTYFLETDMPNVIFHAGRPTQVIAETDVWIRPDGALRSSTLLPKDSVYTVVSSRVRIDESTLRRQGHVDERLTDLGRQVLGPYLQIPESTSPETIALAEQLAAGASSTYDIVAAYEAWLSTNVEYDLNAPLPDAGEDAVHDFLFDTKLGFCEQIASSLTIMLRTQGVPARVATGYVSGSRDEIAGVFEVRASDAHAWVEVWFPETGWQAFDPTATVPLSADAEIGSVGADLVAGLGGYLGAHPLRILVVIGTAFGLIGVIRFGRVSLARHRRGRWGTLQDRFALLALRRGAGEADSNPALAGAWSGADDASVARLIADRLDRVAFDPTFADGDDMYLETRKLVGSLRSTDR